MLATQAKVLTGSAAPPNRSAYFVPSVLTPAVQREVSHGELLECCTHDILLLILTAL